MFTYIPSLLDFLPIQVTTEHYIEFFVLYSRFLLVIYFLHNCVYMSIPIYQVIPSPHSLTLHLCPQPTSPLNSTYLHFITYFPIFCLVFKLTQKILCMILGIQTRLFFRRKQMPLPLYMVYHTGLIQSQSSYFLMVLSYYSSQNHGILEKKSWFMEVKREKNWRK